MPKPYRGKIALDIRDSVPDWEPFLPRRTPEGAPNVLLIAWDDIGYGTMDVYGGPVETPTMRRIAEVGVRYSNFHTTALCSPTRASLLTGRNATSNGMATIAEFSSGFPGISCRIPFENGFISEVLAEQGWNTYGIGKWHLAPGEELNMSSFKGRWPLGRGFERFYGFLGGETSQWYPDLIHDNRPRTVTTCRRISPTRRSASSATPRPSIPTSRSSPTSLPDAATPPHHVFKPWADKYKGRFDQGYEAIRGEILERQKALGLMPDHVELSSLSGPLSLAPDDRRR